MKSAESKLKIVNAILASRSESGRDFFIQSDRAIDYALSKNAKLRSAGEFAALLDAISVLSGFAAESPEDEAKN